MAGAELPERIVDFIVRNIRSLEHLEILLLVSGSPARAWTQQAVYRVIKSSEASVLARLKELADQGFLQEEPGEPPQYRFKSSDEELKAVVAELAAVYRERRLRVVEIIYPGTTSGARNFADAFRIRKDPKRRKDG
jgi:hypothetical protein